MSEVEPPIVSEPLSKNKSEVEPPIVSEPLSKNKSKVEPPILYEARNSKQYLNSNFPNSKRLEHWNFEFWICLEHWNFEFGICFGFRMQPYGESALRPTDFGFNSLSSSFFAFRF